MAIRTHQITVTVTGTAGSATGNATSTQPINGRLIAIHFDFVTQAATADTTVATVNAPVLTMLTLTDTATDAWYYPRVLLQGNTGSNLTAIYDTMPINDYVKVSVAQSDAGSVIATLYIETNGDVL